MKKIFVGLVFCFLIIKEAQAQVEIGQQIATSIAQRLKDSLALTDTQYQLVLNVNLLLHTQKMEVRQLYESTDSIRVHIQGVENQRDSLYLPLIGSEKFLLYIQRKKYLISNP